MKRGSKPLHPHLQAMKGGREDRINSAAPVPAERPPEAPGYLTKEEATQFGVLCSRMEEIGLASDTFTETIAMAATYQAEIEALSREIRKSGLVIKAKNVKGYETIKPNPAVAMRRAADQRMQSLLAELGLTPSSAARVKVPQNAGKKSPWAKYK